VSRKSKTRTHFFCGEFRANSEGLSVDFQEGTRKGGPFDYDDEDGEDGDDSGEAPRLLN
jgi:hypothetical protein